MYRVRIKFSDTTQEKYKKVARKFLKKEFITKQVALELAQEVVSEITPECVRKRKHCSVRLVNTLVDLWYIVINKSDFLCVTICVQLFGDTVTKNFLFKCDEVGKFPPRTCRGVNLHR